jgi:hypothetical protein
MRKTPVGEAGLRHQEGSNVANLSRFAAHTTTSSFRRAFEGHLFPG